MGEGATNHAGFRPMLLLSAFIALPSLAPPGSEASSYSTFYCARSRYIRALSSAFAAFCTFICSISSAVKTCTLPRDVAVEVVEVAALHTSNTLSPSLSRLLQSAANQLSSSA